MIDRIDARVFAQMAEVINRRPERNDLFGFFLMRNVRRLSQWW
ncbi:hypothetical protein Q2V65_25420 [Escherichia coli]|nr:hypothetical protein [Escherichia coli]MDO2886293.1 hypothetical protein [Escherichia coli]